MKWIHLLLMVVLMPLLSPAQTDSDIKAKEKFKGRFGNGTSSGGTNGGPGTGNGKWTGKGTTLEEYNYITKGYKIQIESGLDMKKGYTLKFISQQTTGYGDTFIQALYREGETTPCCIMLKVTRPTIIKTEMYLCVPHHDTSPEIWQKFMDSINTNDARLSNMIAQALGKTVAYFAQNN